MISIHAVTNKFTIAKLMPLKPNDAIFPVQVCDLKDRALLPIPADARLIANLVG